MHKMIETARWIAPIALATTFALASASAACLPDGVQTSGAAYRICMPDSGKWNGSLLIFAHGYVATTEPLGIPENQLVLPDGTSIPTLITSLGVAFAVSGYSVNGLAILQGISDSADLVDIFTNTVGQPQKVFIGGPSEGGLVTALSVERFPNIYDGGLAACGPIGDFPAEIDYIGNFRVVFDYFFPNVIPGSPISVPTDVMDNWDTVYLPRIEAAVNARPASAQQLLSVTGAAVGSDPSTVLETIENVLWYSVFSANDAEAKLGGQPFDNSKKIYSGSSNDFLLNLLAPRFTADSQAVAAMKTNYNTTGLLTRPLVTMHTLLDPIIPYWHEPLYTLKTVSNGSAMQRISIPIQSYGHCNFNQAQTLVAFLALVLKAGGPTPSALDQVLSNDQIREQFHSLSETLQHQSGNFR
jgi:hypothetical protein